MAKKILSIAKDRLEAYLARFCSHCHTMPDSGERVCDRKLPDGCNVSMVDKITMNCPPDCPRWSETKWKHCVPNKCTIMQKAIKNLTETDDE